MPGKVKYNYKPEDVIQAECFQWFWNSYPRLRRTMFAVPNGGARNKMEASRMKGTGTVSGVSDLIWVLPGAVIFIEMKNEVGTQSHTQEEFQSIVEHYGHEYVLIRSLKEFKDFITRYINLYIG